MGIRDLRSKGALGIGGCCFLGGLGGLGGFNGGDVIYVLLGPRLVCYGVDKY